MRREEVAAALSSRQGFQPMKRKRIPGPPSTLPPPHNAPAWTLKEQFAADG